MIENAEHRTNDPSNVDSSIKEQYEIEGIKKSNNIFDFRVIEKLSEVSNL